MQLGDSTLALGTLAFLPLDGFSLLLLHGLGLVAANGTALRFVKQPQRSNLEGFATLDWPEALRHPAIEGENVLIRHNSAEPGLLKSADYRYFVFCDCSDLPLLAALAACG